MSEPTRLSVKRRATDDPPEYLVLQDGKQAATHVRYVRQRRDASVASNLQKSMSTHESESASTNPARASMNSAPAPTSPDTTSTSLFTAPTSPAKQQRHVSRRVYQLQHIPSVIGKRKGIDETDAIATFVERRKKAKQHAEAKVEEEPPPREVPTASPLKRPGKGSAVKQPVATTPKPETEPDRQRIEALAEYMHQAALDEVKRESQPKLVAAPKLSGARSREIHRQRVATNDFMDVSKDVEMEDGSDYVFDTYILAPITDDRATQVDSHNELDNIGYLVITEEDQSLWQTYLEDEPSEKDWNSDEDDENAEGYYGADYPEDEVASDDEFERDPYGYRGHGASDGEEWNEDTGAYSDDEYEQMMNPFRTKKTPQQFAKYLEARDDRDG